MSQETMHSECETCGYTTDLQKCQIEYPLPQYYACEVCRNSAGRLIAYAKWSPIGHSASNISNIEVLRHMAQMTNMILEELRASRKT